MSDEEPVSAVSDAPQGHVRRARTRGGKRQQRGNTSVAKHIASGTFDEAKAGKSGINAANRAKTKALASTLLLEHWGSAGPTAPLIYPKASTPSSVPASASSRRATVSQYTSSASEVLAIAPPTRPSTPEAASSKRGGLTWQPKARAPQAPLYLESSSVPRVREPVKPLQPPPQKAPTVPKAGIRKRAHSSESRKGRGIRTKNKLSTSIDLQAASGEESESVEILFPKQRATEYEQAWHEKDLTNDQPLSPSSPSERGLSAVPDASPADSRSEGGLSAVSDAPAADSRSEGGLSAVSDAPAADSPRRTPSEGSGEFESAQEEDQALKRTGLPWSSAEQEQEDPEITGVPGSSSSASASGGLSAVPDAPAAKASFAQVVRDIQPAPHLRLFACDFHGPLSSTEGDSPSAEIAEAVYSVIRSGYVFWILSFIGREGRRSAERRAHAQRYCRELNTLLRQNHRIEQSEQVAITITHKKFGPEGKGSIAAWHGAHAILDDQVAIIEDARWYDPAIEAWRVTSPARFCDWARFFSQEAEPRRQAGILARARAR